MINAYTLLRVTLGKLNKEENGYLPADLFNLYANAAIVEQEKNGVKALQDPATNDRQLYKDLLFNFSKNSAVVTVNGFAAKPTDYSYYDSMRSIYDDGKRVTEIQGLTSLLCEADNDPTIDIIGIKAKLDQVYKNKEWVKVDLMSSDRVAGRIQSKIAGKAPTKSKPIAEMVTGGFALYPVETASIVIHYYRKPVEGKLVMKIDTITNDEVYDSVNSVDFDWDSEMLDALANDVANRFAVYVREHDLFQMTEAHR